MFVPQPIKPVIITLDRERKLCYPAMAFLAMFRTLGTNAENMNALREIDSLPPDEQISKIAVMLWAGLKTDDPSLTLDQVQEMIYFRNLKYVQEKMMEAMEAARAEEEPSPLSESPQAS